MLSFFRRILGSKVGAFIALGFLAIIAVAFAAGDISNQGGLSVLGGGSGGKAATAGGSSLTASELQTRAQRIFEQERRANPGLQMSQFLAQRGVEQVFDQLVAGLTVSEFADDQGMGVSKRMVDAQIAAIPAFQDASGAFSQDLFRQLLTREGISEKALRDDITRDLIGKQVVGPASLGVRLGDSLVLPYASLLLEARTGRIAAIPATAFPSADPTAAQLQQFYSANAERFTVPEQRRLRYAVVDAARFAGAAQPTDAEIARYYTQNKAAYAATETRSVERLVLPTEAGAKSIAADIRGGTSMAAAAQTAGLAVATLTNQSREALTRESSSAIAQAVFSAQQGALVGPLRAPLGWQLLRVTDIQRTPEQSLAQARGKIVETLRGQKQQKLISDFTAKIEDQVADGATFDEVAKDNGLPVTTTPFLLATGQSVQQTDYRAPPEVQPLLRPAFDMTGDDDPQLVPVQPDQRYALLDVGDILPAAPPPLDKVRDVIAQQYKLDQGAKKAKALAEQLRAKVAKGMKLEDALKSAGVPLPPVQRAGGRRADIMRAGEQRPPAELAILFSMAQGSVKTVPIPGSGGYFLVQLDQIARGDAGKQPQLVNRVRAELSQVVGGEYADQFERAIEKDLGVTRNMQVVKRVKQDLRRANGDSQ